MKRFFALTTIFLLFMGLGTYLPADVSYTHSLVHYVYKMKNKIPRRYTTPTESQIGVFNDAVTALLNSQFASATLNANAIGYTLQAFIDNNGLTYYILASKNAKNRPWGTYIFYLGTDAVNRIIEVPHAATEKNAARIAAELFVDASAETYKPKALFISGSKRGSGDVCSLSSSFFQTAHEAAIDSNTDVVQIHTFNIRSYPQIVFTSGTSGVIPAMDKYVEELIEQFDVGIYNGVMYSNLGSTGNVQAVYTNSIGGNFIGIFLNRQVASSKTYRDDFVDLTEEPITETTTS